MNDFIKNDALKQQKSKLNVTKLIKCEGEIIGFTSLLTDTLTLKKINDEELKNEIKEKLGINKKKKNKDFTSCKNWKTCN